MTSPSVKAGGKQVPGPPMDASEVAGLGDPSSSPGRRPWSLVKEQGTEPCTELNQRQKEQAGDSPEGEAIVMGKGG